MSIRNPLNKRYARELKHDAVKYLAIFVFLTALVAMLTGFLVAGSSTLITAQRSKVDNNIEDGFFVTGSELSEDLLSSLEKNNDLTIYENYYYEQTLGDSSDGPVGTIRIYNLDNREDIDQVSSIGGRLPESDSEIAVDRVYAANNGIEIGDEIVVNGKSVEVVGFCAMSDYTAMYESNDQMMFDATRFGVAVMDGELFETVDAERVTFQYSYLFEEAIDEDDKKEQKERNEQFAENLIVSLMFAGVEVKNFQPAFTNQAIIFAKSDMGRDGNAMLMFLLVGVAVLAFVFAITTNAQVEREASVIGTLLSSGYSRWEMLLHYSLLPTLVIIVALIVGNILGYTVMLEVGKDMYYANYSLPEFVFRFDVAAFLKTSVIPFVLFEIIINVVLLSKLRLSPLRFLRKDISSNKSRRAPKLSHSISIMNRYRLRVLMKNMPTFVMIIVGVTLANLIALLGIIFVPVINENSARIRDSRLADYQYILYTDDIPGIDSDAQFEDVRLASTTSLTYSEPHRFNVGDDNVHEEEITIYGVDARDIPSTSMAGEEGAVVVSKSFASKFHLEVGDEITLTDEYSGASYTYEIDAIDENTQMLIFLPRAEVNEMLEQDDKYFNVILSPRPLDLDDQYVAKLITEDDLDQLGNQMNSSSLLKMFDVFTIFGYAVLVIVVYILSKTVLAKNKTSISLAKILGYHDHEISAIYLRTVSVVTIASIVLTMPLVNVLIDLICEMILYDFAGYFEYFPEVSLFARNALIAIVIYILIYFALVGRIRKAKMTDALKSVE